MPNHVVHFDIPCDDVERARRFYGSVFGWRFEVFGPPDFYLIRTGDAADDADPGIHGALTKRDPPSPAPGRHGFECTIAVASIPETREAVLTAGGSILMEESEIAGVGRLLRFADTEGNAVCAMDYFSSRST